MPSLPLSLAAILSNRSLLSFVSMTRIALKKSSYISFSFVNIISSSSGNVFSRCSSSSNETSSMLNLARVLLAIGPALGLEALLLRLSLS